MERDAKLRMFASGWLLVALSALVFTIGTSEAFAQPVVQCGGKGQPSCDQFRRLPPSGPSAVSGLNVPSAKVPTFAGADRSCGSGALWTDEVAAQAERQNSGHSTISTYSSGDQEGSGYGPPPSAAPMPPDTEYFCEITIADVGHIPHRYVSYSTSFANMWQPYPPRDSELRCRPGLTYVHWNTPYISGPGADKNWRAFNPSGQRRERREGEDPSYYSDGSVRPYVLDYVFVWACAHRVPANLEVHPANPEL